MENVVIRESMDKDTPVILELLYELGRPRPQQDYELDLFRKLVKQYTDDADKTILIAELDGVEIIGMVSIVFLSRLNQINRELYIPELIVREKFQHQGIGKKLINSCISIAKEEKCHRIRLESGNKRTASHKFYKKLGFEQSGFSFTKNLN